MSSMQPSAPLSSPDQTLPHVQASVEGLIATESINPRTVAMDSLSTLELLRAINAEDQQVALAVEQALPAVVPVVEAVAEAFRRGGRLFYVGAGTSGRLGVLDASECPPTFGVPGHWVQALIAGGDVALRHAVEGAEDQAELAQQDVAACQWTDNDVVVGLSASGSARYVIRAMELAAQVPVALTACVTCVPKSALSQAVTCPIVVETGPEVLSGSTRLKAGTAQKLVLNLITTASMVRIGKTYGNLMVDVRPTNAKLRQRAIRLVSQLGQVDPEQARQLLEASGWQVKPAIVMARRAVDCSTAESMLAHHQGILRRLIG